MYISSPSHGLLPREDENCPMSGGCFAVFTSGGFQDKARATRPTRVARSVTPKAKRVLFLLRLGTIKALNRKLTPI